MSKTNSGDHRHSFAGGLHGLANDLEVLCRRQRIHLPGATGRNYRAHRMGQQAIKIVAQSGYVQRQVGFEWCDRKGNHAGEFAAKFQGVHINLKSTNYTGVIIRVRTIPATKTMRPRTSKNPMMIKACFIDEAN
jgi:hypothetical protein